MHTTRNKLFSAAAVFAIAMVLGAWTTSTRAGGEDQVFSIVALLDGYEFPPTKLAGTLCIAHAATYNQVDPVNTWYRDAYNHPNFTLDQRQIQDYLGTASGWMYVEAFDFDNNYDDDSIDVNVSSTGETCEG